MVNLNQARIEVGGFELGFILTSLQVEFHRKVYLINMKVSSWLGDWRRSCPKLQTKGGSKDIAYFTRKVVDDCVLR